MAKPISGFLRRASAFPIFGLMKRVEKFAPALSPATVAIMDKINPMFVGAKAEIVVDLREAAESRGRGSDSFNVGHKIIAARSTLLSRLYGQLQNLYANPLQGFADIAKKDSKLRAAIIDKIEESSPDVSLTMHPTEGQNQRAIKEKDAIVKLQVNLISAVESEEVTGENLVVLARIAKDLGIDATFVEEAKKSGLPSLQEFKKISRLVQKEIIKSFVENPIHHVTKMTVDDERELLSYHMKRCKWDTASLVTRFPGIITMKNVELRSWAADMDGKPHVKSGHGLIFEHKVQNEFFSALIERLEDVADEMDLNGQNGDSLRLEVIEKLHKIHEESAKRILVGDEAAKYEAQISSLMEEFEKGQEQPLGTLFAEAQNFVKDSGCKVATIGFSTREEIDNTLKAFAEVAKICIEKNPELRAEIGDEIDEEKLAKFFLKYAADERITKTLAENFDQLPDGSKKGEIDVKRQVLCAMEAMSLHPNHEHIISQFDCKKSSFVAALAFFEVVKNSARHLAKVESLKKHYDEKSAAAGFDMHAQLFSDEAITNIEKSVVELSPLAEERETIERLIPFTRAMLDDPDICEYIRKSGGIVRQTRSNSDGSDSCGAQLVSALYLKADIAIQEMVKEAGFELKLLAGMGNNDSDRMAPLSIEGMSSRYTAQGGDMQHLNGNRFSIMLAREVGNPSQEAWTAFAEKYKDRMGEVDALLEFYYEKHYASEKGCLVEFDGKKTWSGYTTHRGPIPGTVVAKYLTNLSSRTDSRTGDVGADGFEGNSAEDFHKSVYNDKMRRIGATALQRATGLQSFLLAPFFEAPDVDLELLHDFCAIPSICNSNLVGLFALGTADMESFLLANGLNFEVPDDAIPLTAEIYKEFLQIEDPKELEEFAKKHGLDSLEGVRVAHLCYQIQGAKFALRNMISPLIEKSSPEVKAAMEAVFKSAESGAYNKEYHKEVLAASEILAHDQAIDLETRQTIACVAQQIANVRREGNFYDTRKELVKEAHDALESGDKDAFNKSCEKQAIIMRSAGNPLSPGRKTEELLRYFVSSLTTVFPMNHLLLEAEMVKPRTSIDRPLGYERLAAQKEQEILA